MKAIILSGGLGTRLRPLTYTTPKALLPLLNRPFVEYQIDLLRKYRIGEAIFCLNYKPQLFKKYFAQSPIPNPQSPIRIDYVVEKEPLGTGGAVKNASRTFGIKETVMIFNGDVLTDIDLSKIISFHQKKKAKVTITLVRVKDPTIYGLVETDDSGRIKRFLEKPSLDEVTTDTINAGIYIFDPGVLDYIPSGVNYSLERGLFPLLLENKLPIYGYVHNGYWLDIGTVEKYLQANFDLLNGKMKSIKIAQITGNRKRITARGKIVFGEKTKISDSAQILGNVCLGKNCFLGGKVFLKDSIIFNNVYIGEGAKIENSVIGNNCRIEANAALSPGNALGDGSVIRKYSRL